MIRAWVDPEFGVDGPGIGSSGSPMIFAQVNDKDAPFKTLQHAINAVEHHLVSAYNAGDPLVEGLVYAMPGLYAAGSGAPGSGGNGEVFPIKMRDRVHVQAQGARGCVIRGSGPNPMLTKAFWPECSNPRERPDVEVLVSYSHSGRLSRDLFPTGLPWTASTETGEMFDSFTLQGGEIQVLFDREVSTTTFTVGTDQLAGRITNCLFDMRSFEIPVVEGPPILVQGPWIGIEMAKLYGSGNGGIAGYADMHVLIANNTFVMCEMGTVDPLFQIFEPITLCRAEAVAIIDVTNSGCFTSGIPADTDPTLRGLGHPIIANNLFRTPPDQFSGPSQFPFAMLGIDNTDTLTTTAGTGPIPTNAFSSTRVGATNGFFCSQPVQPLLIGLGTLPPAPLWDCRNPSAPTSVGCAGVPAPAPCSTAGVQLPVPAVEIYRASGQGLDPAFVGEYLQNASLVTPFPQAPQTRYRDWRILPGSPLIDMGVTPQASPSGTPTLSHSFPTIFEYREPTCPELRSFDWDHEVFGNPRTSGSNIDIGFDEFQLFIMSGSYANDSNSHNLSGFMNPTVETGRPLRHMIFTRLQAGATEISVNGVFAVQAPPPAAPPPAWIQPPRTTRVVTAGLPPGFDIRWISFNNTSTSMVPPMGTAMPWMTGTTGLINVSYPIPWNNTQLALFARYPVADPEVSTGYFGAQAVFHAGPLPQGAKLYSNLQYEYR